jgi:hypothetical protein
MRYWWPEFSLNVMTVAKKNCSAGQLVNAPLNYTMHNQQISTTIQCVLSIVACRLKVRLQINGFLEFVHPPEFEILCTKKNKISETRSVSILRWRNRAPTLVGPRKELTSNIRQPMLKLKLSCDRQSVGQFFLVYVPPMGPMTRF